MTMPFQIRHRLPILILLLFASGLFVAGCGSTQPEPLLSDAVWYGNAIAYSGYRKGQSPDTHPYPSEIEILEDLRILERNWQLIRLYGADEFSRRVLSVISREKLPLKVMLGAWLNREPDAVADNAQQIAEAIRLAKAYPEIVVAINVGNEILVDWSFHPVPEEKAIRYVQQVQAEVDVPVTVADNYAYWRDHGQKLAQVVDFVTIHTYPIWEKRDIDQGLSYTIENVNDVREILPPGKPVVIGEAGWATYTVGDLHVKQAGDEAKQTQYYQELTEWCRRQSIPLFWFEAFDESWKGTGTEGYWGLFTETRKAKPAMHAVFPDLVTGEPTSPSYSTATDEQSGVDLTVITTPASRVQLGSARAIPFTPSDDIVTLSAVSRPGVTDEYLLFEYSGDDWGGFYFIFPESVAAGIHTHLILELHSTVDLADMELKLEGPREKGASVNLIKYAGSTTNEGWQRFAVPLADFRGIDQSQLAVIGFWNPKAGDGSFQPCRIKIDNLDFGIE